MFGKGVERDARGGLRYLVGCAVMLGMVLTMAACSGAEKPLSPNLAPAVPGSLQDFQNRAGDRIYFLTDSSELTSEARRILDNQAVWLNQYPQHQVTIEGHADERGTREYNLALGGQRATATRNYLIARGINGTRIQILSFGKERPVAVCNDISCWSQNRRAVTLLGR